MIDANLDKISWLPHNVIDHILSHLPIKEAIGTSVLSSKWNNKWRTLPNLVFLKDSEVITSKFLKLVHNVLLLHDGPIKKFEIHDEHDDDDDDDDDEPDKINLVGVNPTTDIDPWIFYLIGRSIEKFVLDISMEQPYKIPRLLFSCQSLHHLELNCCELKPPTTFEGFRNLKSLVLANITMTQDDFENLISKSPLLEKFIMKHFDGVSKINLHLPNLKVFHFKGGFKEISFANTPIVADLMLEVDYGNKCSVDFLQFFADLPHIQKLDIDLYFLKCLIAGDVLVPVKLSTPCINLRALCLYIKFDNLKQISAALCLLKSAPNLQEFAIVVVPKGRKGFLTLDKYCWDNMFSEPTMPFQLRGVMLYGANGFKLESDFIKFLLLYSPLLEKMIVYHDKNVKSGLKMELLQFKRAEKSKLIYSDIDGPVFIAR